jgi:hypothetical protein
MVRFDKLEELMHQSKKFLATLKRCLKTKGVSYKNLATALKISETSVKRIFSEGTLSLERIGEILEILDMTFLDVAKLIDGGNSSVGDILSFDQESVLASDQKLFAFFNLILFGKSVDDVCNAYTISKDDAKRYVRILTDLGLILARSDGSIKMRTNRAIRWLEQGPLREAYGAKIRAEFLDNPFTGDHEILTFKTRSLSHGSKAAIKRKIELLMAEMDELAAIDGAVLKRQTRPTSFMVGFRPFAFSSVEALKKR